MRSARSLARLSLPLLGLGGLVLGCVEESPLANRGEPRRGASTPPPALAARPAATDPVRVATEAKPLPSGLHPVDAVFGGSIQVVGYKLEPATLRHGETGRITLVFRVLNPVMDDDMVFVHLEDADGAQSRVNVDHWPAGHRAAMNSWKKGDVIEDTFTLPLDNFESSRAVTLWMGLWEPNRDERMPLTSSGQLKNDGNGRLALADLLLQ
jgi:hypothetical protein